MILAPQIIYILSGPGYEGAILPMRIIMPAAFAVGMAQVLAIQVLMPMKKDKVLLVASIIGAVVSLTINLTLVSYLKSIGTAVVLVGSEMIVTVVYIFYVLRYKIVCFSTSFMYKSLLCSLPSSIICLFCSYYIESLVLSFFIAFIFALISWIILYSMFFKPSLKWNI